MNNNQKRKAIFKKMKEYKNTIGVCENYNCNIFKNCLVEIERLNNIIDKAIEYIEEIQTWCCELNDYGVDSTPLLKILKGVDKE